MKEQEYTADLVMTPDGLRSGFGVVMDTETGTVLSLHEASPDAHYIPGLLSPGWINAHCHLELSHLQGMIPTHTGMAGFIRHLQALRSNHPETAESAAWQAARDMFQAGIQAVADISNTEVTVALKHSSQHDIPEFYTFVELFGLNPDRAGELVQQGLDKKALFPQGKSSLTWHAPYSTSPVLFPQIGEQVEGVASFHLLESEEEMEIMESASGPLATLFREMGFDPLPEWFGRQPVLDFVLRLLPENLRMLWVHGVMLTAGAVEQILAHHPQSGFCLCPAANEYIHGTCPPVRELLPWKNRIVLGTDSLAGNHRLDLLDDVKILTARFPEIETEDLLTWVTQNGADFFGWQHLGNLSPGKRPGLIAIHSIQGDRITPHSRIQRIL